MSRAAAACATLVLAAALAGCGLVPYSEESLPPIEAHGLRVTKGPGAGRGYAPVVDVSPGSTVQVLTEVADGNTVIVSMPRGPATEIEVTAHVEGEPESEGVTSTIRSAGGEPITLSGLHEFDPGYVGVEHHSDADTLSLRLATPRLTGTGQGQVPFTFKTKVE